MNLLNKRTVAPKFRDMRYTVNPEGGFQEMTSCWKSIHRVRGYQGYHPDIRGLLNEYQEKVEQI